MVQVYSIDNSPSGWGADFPDSATESVACAEWGDGEALTLAYVIAERCVLRWRGTGTHLEGGLAVNISTC